MCRTMNTGNTAQYEITIKIQEKHRELHGSVKLQEFLKDSNVNLTKASKQKNLTR